MKKINKLQEKIDKTTSFK